MRGDGLVEVRKHRREAMRANAVGLPIREILLPFAELLAFVGAFRVRAGRPELEFVLDFEWRAARGGQLLLPSGWGVAAAKPVQLANRVTDYVMLPREGIGKLYSDLQTDVLSSVGFGEQIQTRFQRGGY
jgi:hypothetical protein